MNNKYNVLYKKPNDIDNTIANSKLKKKKKRRISYGIFCIIVSVFLVLVTILLYISALNAMGMTFLATFFLYIGMYKIIDAKRTHKIRMKQSTMELKSTVGIFSRSFYKLINALDDNKHPIHDDKTIIKRNNSKKKTNQTWIRELFFYGRNSIYIISAMISIIFFMLIAQIPAFSLIQHYIIVVGAHTGLFFLGTFKSEQSYPEKYINKVSRHLEKIDKEKKYAMDKLTTIAEQNSLDIKTQHSLEYQNKKYRKIFWFANFLKLIYLLSGAISLIFSIIYSKSYIPIISLAVTAILGGLEYNFRVFVRESRISLNNILSRYKITEKSISSFFTQLHASENVTNTKSDIDQKMNQSLSELRAQNFRNTFNDIIIGTGLICISILMEIVSIYLPVPQILSMIIPITSAMIMIIGSKFFFMPRKSVSHTERKLLKISYEIERTTDIIRSIIDNTTNTLLKDEDNEKLSQFIIDQRKKNKDESERLAKEYKQWKSSEDPLKIINFMKKDSFVIALAFYVIAIAIILFMYYLPALPSLIFIKEFMNIFPGLCLAVFSGFAIDALPEKGSYGTLMSSINHKEQERNFELSVLADTRITNAAECLHGLKNTTILEEVIEKYTKEFQENHICYEIRPIIDRSILEQAH